MHESIVFCSTCTITSFVKKFTFAVSSPDEFLVNGSAGIFGILEIYRVLAIALNIWYLFWFLHERWKLLRTSSAFLPGWHWWSAELKHLNFLRTRQGCLVLSASAVWNRHKCCCLYKRDATCKLCTLFSGWLLKTSDMVALKDWETESRNRVTRTRVLSFSVLWRAR